MPISKLRPSFTFTEDRLAELRAVVPEAFADGDVNWDVLREAVGEHLEDDGSQAEHFGLFWPGKRGARRLAAMPSKGTLVPTPGEGLNEATTGNVFIEGDNLEVLKLLQKSYAGRVKLIYLDPPYNTGNDLLYIDDYREPLQSYLLKTEQVDQDGSPLTTNSRASGRYHSNWLNMMYSRLLLARQLLRVDGAIFVSIDDHEVANLVLLMNEVFGEESFVADIAIVNNLKGRNDRANIATAHEHLLFYASPEFASLGLRLTDKQITEYGESDELGEAFQWRDLRKRGGADTRVARPKLHFPIYANPVTGEVALEASPDKPIKIIPLKSDGSEGCWRWGKDKVVKNINSIRASKVAGKERWGVSYRVYLAKDGKMRSAKPKSVWFGSQFSTDSATKGLRELLPSVSGFTPKPVGLMTAILQQTTEDDDIVLDLFAGSCTLAQATLELNRDDGGARRFVMVQLPEPIDLPKYGTMAEIGKDRIRKTISRIQPKGRRQPERDDRETALDLGFRVFCLAHSNLKPWEDYTGDDARQLELLFENAASHLVDGWNSGNVLVEIQLLEGFPLDSTVTKLVSYSKNNVLQVESDVCTHRLFVCLDKTIMDATLEHLQMQPVDVFVCLDSALTDEAKVRLGDLGNLRVI